MTEGGPNATAFAVRTRRDVIIAHGTDARSFLHSQLSNDIASLGVGASRYSFVLEPTGKLAALVRVRCEAEDVFVLDVDEGCGQSALARLNKFKIRVKCEFELSQRDVLALRGLAASSRDAVLAVPGAVAAWREDDCAVDVFDADTQDARGIIAGVESGDRHDLERERVRCAWPVFGVDIDGDCLPAETSLIDVCVSFTKGCYPGQELVERMDSRGASAPRRLMRLPARAAATGSGAVVVAAAGEPYANGGIVLGRCSSVAGDFALVMVARAHFGDAEALASP
jgi:folate-binding protein YgfZ